MSPKKDSCSSSIKTTPPYYKQVSSACGITGHSIVVLLLIPVIFLSCAHLWMATHISLEPRLHYLKGKMPWLCWHLIPFFLYIKNNFFKKKIRDCVYYVSWIHLCIVMPVGRDVWKKKKKVGVHIRYILQHECAIMTATNLTATDSSLWWIWATTNQHCLRRARPQPYWLMSPDGLNAGFLTGHL